MFFILKSTKFNLLWILIIFQFLLIIISISCQRFLFIKFNDGIGYVGGIFTGCIFYNETYVCAKNLTIFDFRK